MSAELSEPESGQSVCMPCRGTGVVLASRGEEREELACPWCGGEGRYMPGRDAQQSSGEHDPG